MRLVPTSLLIYLSFSLSHAQQNGDVRLVDGPSKNKGRVEVYYDGVWGTVCDDSWNRRDADVICQQLGYLSAERYYYRAYYGEGTGPIWVDQINCDARDQSILECRHRGWGIHDCKHFEDAAVDCKRIEPQKPRDLPVRLSCPEFSDCGSCKLCPDKKFPDPTDCIPQATVEGIVEVFYDKEWHPVSTQGWDMSSAHVVCGELGYPLAMSIPTLEELWCEWDGDDCVGSGTGLIESCGLSSTAFRERMNTTWLKELECTGKENRLLDCYFKEFGPIASFFIDVATVRCGFSAHPECSRSNKSAELYRTRGSTVPWNGRIEVRINGEWGTIGDKQWDMTEASVACKALGYGAAVRPRHRSSFGRGAGKVHLNTLDCKGTESLLSECSSRPVYVANHAYDAGVECRVPQLPDNCGQAPGCKILTESDTIGFLYTNFVEVQGPEGWGLLCHEAIDLKAAAVICRETSQMFPFRIRKASNRNTTKTRYTWSLQCTGDESNLNDCPRSLLPASVCIDQEAVVDCSAGLADLVPHLEVFERSLHNYYVQELPLYYLNCAQEENCLSSSAIGKSYDHRRQLLRFSSQTMNYGTANFEPILDRDKWIWHSCHSHFHSFEAFIHYDLIDPITGKKAAEGHKASFCLEDSFCEGGIRSNYRCSSGHQGISPNCGDLYGSYLDCQWIDVTDVPAGRYIIRQTVNPERLSLETDYNNNVVECIIEWGIPGYYRQLVQVEKGSCHLADH